jgi:predicted ATPase
VDLRVRIGVHAGAAQERDGNYFGPAVNRAARLMAVGHGGQTLLSRVVVDLLGDEAAGFDLVPLGVHELRDLGRAEEIHQLGSERFGPLRTSTAVPTNLPARLTSFVGRESEMDTVTELLGEHRLVTLVGVGGSGKTRLALEVAGRLMDRFGDGVWLVELARVARDDELVDELMTSLGARTQGGETPRAACSRYLARRRALVVLDNCEHLLDIAAELVDELLVACPELTVLATSREPLAAAGEQVWVVPSLRPDEAVQLFVERARSVDVDFAPSGEEATLTEEICGRLDGMPLAVELAAVRVPSLDLATIAELLDERFRLLTGGRRGRVERHKTLKASVDWSYEALDDTERAVFEALAVFAGTFDLAAAAAVSDLAEVEAADVVGSLVDKSLVQAQLDPSLGRRYLLLETMRAYGVDRLAERSALDEHRMRMAVHYADRYWPMRSHRFGPGELRARDEMMRDTANLRAAFELAMTTGVVDTAIDLALGLAHFGLDEGWFEPTAWVAELLTVPGIEGSSRYADLLGWRSYELLNDRRPEGQDLALRAIEVGEATDTNAVRARVVAGAYQSMGGEIDQFLECCDRAIAEALSRDDTDEWVHTEWFRAWVLATAGRQTQAIEAAERYAAGTAALGSPSIPGFAEGLLGRAYAPVDPQRALRHCEQALEIGRRGGHWAVVLSAWQTQLSLEVRMSPAREAAGSAAAFLRWCIETDALWAYTAEQTMRFAAMICSEMGDSETVLEIEGYLVSRTSIRASKLDRFTDAVAGAAEQHPDPDAPRARGAALSQAELVDRVLAALDRIAMQATADVDRR